MSDDASDSSHAQEVFCREEPATPVVRDERDHFYLPGEKHFGASGPAMAENGWAVFPQERDERRRPARIDGTPILWSRYLDVPPTTEEIHRWSIYAATQNTAIVLGPASGNAVCVDLDIVDEALSFAVRELAVAVLGETPYRRVGSHPKVALIYRMAPDELPGYSRREFSEKDGSKSESAIEILARGRSITAEGIHHKTGSYFTWLHMNPILTGPEAATLITPAQLKAFLDAVEELRPFYRQPSSWIDDGGHIERDGHDYLYLPNELHFAASGPPMARNGWAVYPQERDERRRPARIDGVALRWGQYHDVPPTTEEIHRWSIYAATQNTAIILGPPSGNTICLDCDILDEELSFQVRDVAARVLGESPFRRVGTHPKIALIYRMQPGDLARYSQHVFATADGATKSEDMIEVLARGRSLTAEGIHYRTGKYFTWLDANPISSAPDRAPLITTAQLDQFFAEVEKLRSFFRRAAREFEPDLDLETVDVHGAVLELPRTLVPTDGKMRDNRKTWLFNFIKDSVAHNPVLAMRGDAGLFDAIYGRALAALELRGSEWDKYREQPELALARDIRKQIRDRVCAIREGKLRPRQVTKWNTGASDDGDDTLNYFGTKSALKNIEIIAPPDAVRAEQRKLWKDRSAAREKVRKQTIAAVNAWASDVIAQNNRVHVAPAPTGSGKTTVTTQQIASHPRLLDVVRGIAASGDEAAPERRGPIVFLLPSHPNIDEAMKFAALTHLDPASTDDELVQGAVETGMVEHEARAQVDKVRRFAVGRAVTIMRLDGKERAGCYKSGLVAKLRNAEIPTSMLCKSKVRGEDGAYIEKFCDHYSECPVIAMRRRLPGADIVFAPRTYLTLPLPAELKKVAGVVADEAIFNDVIGSGVLPFEYLRSGRGAPALTLKEKGAGIDEALLLADRQAGAHIVMEALRDRRDPAEVLYAHRDKFAGKTKLGGDYVRAGKRVCGTAFTVGHSIDPSLPMDQLARAVDELVARPAGFYLKPEYGMWRTFEERIEKMAGAELNSQAAALPKKDPLLQYHRDNNGTEAVRISYAREVNWPDVPWILLDASANEQIVESIFPERDVVSWDVSADVNIRTVASVDFEWSKRIILPGEDCSPMQRLDAAQHLANARYFISQTCGLHANGRVLVGTTFAYRKAILTGWTPPKNADFLHFRATAGHDFGRQHAAAIAIGRSETPQRAVDGLVGALARNDEEPEEPIDVFGLGGLDPWGNKLPPVPLVQRILHLRDGSDVSYLVRQPKGAKAQAVVEQGREEEIRQFDGRLRGLQREDTTTLYLITKAVPSDIIVDRLVSLTDLKNQARSWEAVRRANGVIEPRLLAKVAPDINSEPDFRKWMHKLPKAVLARYHRISVDSREYLVPGYLPDPIGHLRELLSKLGALRSSDVIELLERCGCTLEPAAPRPRDKVEIYLAEHAEERAKYVANFMSEQWKHIRDSGVDLAASRGVYVAPSVPEEIARIAKTVDVWLAYSTIMDPWIRHDVDDIEQAPADEIVQEAANDDQVGDPLTAAIRKAFGMGAA